MNPRVTYPSALQVLRLQPECRFLREPDELTIVSGKGLFRLRTPYASALHARLEPVLRGGCAPAELFRALPAEKQPAVRAYLRALASAGALCPVSRYRTPATLPARASDEGARMVTSASGASALVKCPKPTFLSLWPDLERLARDRLLLLVLTPNRSVSFPEEISGWLLSANHRPESGWLVYEWEPDASSLRLVLDRTAVTGMKMQEVLHELQVIAPRQEMSQLPLAVLSVSREFSSAPATWISVHYFPAANEAIHTAAVSQSLTRSLRPDATVLTSVSRIELRAKLIDHLLVRSRNRWQQSGAVDLLYGDSDFPQTRYLQSVLRTRGIALRAQRWGIGNAFHVLEWEGLTCGSVLYPVAEHGLLLRAAAGAVYGKQIDAGMVRMHVPYAYYAEVGALRQAAGHAERMAATVSNADGVVRGCWDGSSERVYWAAIGSGAE